MLLPCGVLRAIPMKPPAERRSAVPTMRHTWLPMSTSAKGDYVSSLPRVSSGGSHERTINAVGIIRHPDAESIKQDLLRLKRLRVNADYRLGYTGARRQVREAIEGSARIIAWIDAFP